MPFAGERTFLLGQATHQNHRGLRIILWLEQIALHIDDCEELNVMEHPSPHVAECRVVENPVGDHHSQSSNFRFKKLDAAFYEQDFRRLRLLEHRFARRIASHRPFARRLVWVPDSGKLILLEDVGVVDYDACPERGIRKEHVNGVKLSRPPSLFVPGVWMSQAVGLVDTTCPIIVHDHVHLRRTDQSRVQV